MKSVAAALALLALLLASCSPSPTSASEPSRPAITSLSPDAGPAITSLSPDAGSIGTSITISGSGFTSSGNTVTFTVLALTPGGTMPNQPSVIPNLTSNGSTIVFSILPVWRPACSYAPPGPCPIAHIPTASGSYSVTVTNAQGVSNSVTLVVR